MGITFKLFPKVKIMENPDIAIILPFIIIELDKYRGC